MIVLLFALFIIYDTSAIMRKYDKLEYIEAAMALYIDFIGLFIYLTRMLGLFGR